MAFKRSGVRFPSPPLGRRELREFYVFMRRRGSCAGIAQLVEHNLAKVGVAGSSPVSRSGSIFLVQTSLQSIGRKGSMPVQYPSSCHVGRLAQLVRAPR